MSTVCFTIATPVVELRRPGPFALVALCVGVFVCSQGPASADVPSTASSTGPNGDSSPSDVGPLPTREDVRPLSGPFAEIPEKDRLRSFSAPPALAGGTLLYCEYVPKGAIPGDYHMGLVLRTSTENQQRPGACEVYYEEGAAHLFDPVLLPGGGRVLVKYGDYPGGDYLSSYGFYVVDLVSHKWKSAAPFDFIFPRVAVSVTGRFVAAIHGGSIAGRIARFSEMISLIVFDTVTGDYRVVLKGLYEAPTVAWLNQGTLLFEAPEPRSHDSKGRPVGPDPSVPGERPAPGIFEEPAMGGVRMLLMRHALDPLPSPDGRWIAFWGWPDSPAALAEDMGFGEGGLGDPSPYLYEVATKRRYPLKNDLVEGSDKLVWTPDSRRLLMLRREAPRSDGSLDCKVLAMTVGSGEAGVPRTAALVGTLHANSAGAFHGSAGGQFRPIRFVNDGRYLLVVKTENKGLDKYHYYNYEDSLDSLDLKTGDVRELARMYEDLEMDWSEKPLLPLAWAAKKGAAK